MGNRFVGDIGDFAKYGLLRALTKGADGPARRLGAVWYANSDDPETTSGRKTAYLENNASYLSCDPELYASLREMVVSGRRTLSEIKDSGILGPATRFWTKPTPLKAATRSEWLDGALEEMDGCGLVFMDPDNGLVMGSPASATVSLEHAYESRSSRPSPGGSRSCLSHPVEKPEGRHTRHPDTVTQGAPGGTGRQQQGRLCGPVETSGRENLAHRLPDR